MLDQAQELVNIFDVLSVEINAVKCCIHQLCDCGVCQAWAVQQDVFRKKVQHEIPRPAGVRFILVLVIVFH